MNILLRCIIIIWGLGLSGCLGWQKHNEQFELIDATITIQKSGGSGRLSLPPGQYNAVKTWDNEIVSYSSTGEVMENGHYLLLLKGVITDIINVTFTGPYILISAPFVPGSKNVKVTVRDAKFNDTAVRFSTDGFEQQVALNSYGRFDFSNELYDALSAGTSFVVHVLDGKFRGKYRGELR